MSVPEPVMLYLPVDASKSSDPFSGGEPTSPELVKAPNFSVVGQFETEDMALPKEVNERGSDCMPQLGKRSCDTKSFR